jgi:hypothetical protein
MIVADGTTFNLGPQQDSIHYSDNVLFDSDIEKCIPGASDRKRKNRSMRAREKLEKKKKNDGGEADNVTEVSKEKDISPLLYDRVLVDAGVKKLMYMCILQR